MKRKFTSLMRLGPSATFDELVELYEADPVRFIEEIFQDCRYECVVSDECANCQSWDEINGTEPRRITRKNHTKDGVLPYPHRFEPDTAFYPLPAMSKDQVRHHIRRLHRRQTDEANLLHLYYQEKFQRASLKKGLDVHA